MLTTAHIDAWELTTRPRLDGDARGHVDACPRCRAALNDARELAVMLGAALPVPEHSPSLRAQLVGEAAHHAGAIGLLHRLESVSAHLGLDIDDTAAALTRLPDPAVYLPVFPGVSICPIGQDVSRGFGRVEPGARFPEHRHLDRERFLVLSGSCLDSRLGWLGPGDLSVHEAGTTHTFEVPRTVPLLFAFTSGGLELLPG